MNKYETMIEDLNNGILSAHDKIDDIHNNNIINRSPINEIERSIEGLNGIIHEIEEENVNRSRIKNIKIFKEFTKMALPYVVVAGLLFGIQTLTFDVPFAKQDQFKVAKTASTLDSLSVFGTETNYVVPSEKKSTDHATYVTKWEKRGDGKYYRTIKEYNFKTLDGIYSLQLLLNLRDPNQQNKLFHVYEDPSSTRYESRFEGELTEEELAQDDYVKLTYYSFDEKNFIISSQDDLPNIIYSVIYLLALSAAGAGIYFGRKNLSNYDYLEIIKNIKEMYPEIDISYSKGLFEELKERFSKVKNEQVTLVDPITNEGYIVK